MSGIKYSDRDHIYRFDYEKIRKGTPIKVLKTNNETLVGRFIKFEKYTPDEYKKRYDKALAILDSIRNEIMVPIPGDDLVITQYPEYVVSGVFSGWDFDLTSSRSLMIINTNEDSSRKLLNIERIRSVQFNNGNVAAGRRLRSIFDDRKLPYLTSLWLSTTDGVTIIIGLEEIRSINHIKFKLTTRGWIVRTVLVLGILYYIFHNFKPTIDFSKAYR